MVQNVSNSSPNGFGTINRVGMTNNGRMVYQIIDSSGQQAVKVSIPQKDCDKFEKSYRDLMESAPKVQRYAQTTSPEKMKRQKTIGNWIVGISTAIGVGVPLMLSHGKWWKQALWATGGAIAGLAAGLGISIATTTPPGAMQFAKATQNISKMDIQPVQE